MDENVLTFTCERWGETGIIVLCEGPDGRGKKASFASHPETLEYNLKIQHDYSRQVVLVQRMIQAAVQSGAMSADQAWAALGPLLPEPLQFHPSDFNPHVFADAEETSDPTADYGITDGDDQGVQGRDDLGRPSDW